MSSTVKNASLPLYILYYVWQQGDTTRYSLTLKGVADLKPSLDEYGLREIVNWQLPFPPPTDAILTSYDDALVKSWYNNTYELPAQVSQAQSAIRDVSFTSDQIASMATDDLADNTLVFNTTSKQWMAFDKPSNTWIIV